MPSFYREVQITNSGVTTLTDHEFQITNPLFDETDLRLSLSFNEDSGDFTADEGGRNDGLTFSNTTIVTTSGLQGNARSFNGTTSKGSLTHAESVHMNMSGETELTFSAWVYPRARQTTDTHDTIIIKRQYLLLDGAGKIGAYLWTLTAPGYHYSDTAIPLNQWSHIGWTWNSSDQTVRFYLDGVADGTASTTSGSLDSGSAVMYVGGQASTEFFEGDIAQVKVWSRQLSADEMEEQAGTRNYRSDYVGVKLFSNPDLSTELNWWKERDGLFWVKDTVGAESTNTLYLGYGDEVPETDTSDPDNVFEFFDDFRGNNTTVSGVKWTEIDTSSKISTDDKLVVTGGTGTWGQTGIYSDSSWSRASQNYIAESRFKKTPTFNGYGPMFGWKDDTGSMVDNNMVYSHFDAHNVNIHYIQEKTTYPSTDPIDYAVSETIIFQITTKTTGAEYKWTDDVRETFTLEHDSSAFSDNPLHIAYNTYQGSFEARWALVRKATSNVIGINVGIEKNAPTLSYLGHQLFIEGNTPGDRAGHVIGVPYSDGKKTYVYFPKNSRHDTIGIRTITFFGGKGVK